MATIPEFIFDTINGPTLVLLSGSVSSSVYMTEHGTIGFGSTGISSVDTASWANASSYAERSRTASYFNTSDIVQLTASYGQITDLSVYHLRSIPGYDTIIVDAPIDVTGSFYGTSSVAMTASYVPCYAIDAFETSQIGTSAGGIIIVEHFLSPTTALISSFASTNSGTSAAVTIVSGQKGHPGIIQQSTGTTATGRSSTISHASCVLFGSGTYTYETCIQIPTLSIASQRFTVYAGFGDNSSGGDMVDGAYFQYSDAASTFWQLKTSTNSVRTTSTTNVTVNAGSWYKLKVIVTNNTSAEFYINDSFVGTIATNIPSATGQETGIIIKTEKSIGTTARTTLIDFVKVTYK